MVLTTITLLALAGLQDPRPQPGEVQLPLDEYLALVESAEAAERAAAAAAASAEPTVAEIASQRTSIAWENESAALTTTYEVLLRGDVTEAVSLPVTGLVWSAAIRPSGTASLRETENGLELVALEPGRYEVELQSRAPVAMTKGVGRLTLAPFGAPVGDYQIQLPQDLLFRCPGAVVAEDVTTDGQRRVRFALARGRDASIEVHPDLADGAGELLASAVVVTLVDLRRDGPLRHDVVLYEIARGQMVGHEISLPPGLEVERLATDEGESPALAVDGTIRVQRRKKLDRTGYVVLTSRPPDVGEIPLSKVTPQPAVRARYLAVSSAVAAEFSPTPASAWLRVDLQDLPPSVRSAASGADLVAAWRLDDEGASTSLAVSLRPRAPLLDTVVTERETLTLLTPEGTLVHRDRFTVSGDASALSLRLPEGAVLWSLQADDLLVRPVERGGRLLVPLSPGNGQTETVEVIAVQERAVPTERERIGLSLSELEAPVLSHRWRLMLPEGHRYRFAGGDLSPVVEPPPERNAGRFAVEGPSRALGMGGSASVWGRVSDYQGLALPGSTVTLTNEGTGWSATVLADKNGSFWFVSLPPGSYRLVCELAGFRTGYYENIPLRSGETAAYRIPLDLLGVEESVTVTGAPPPMTSLEDKAPEEKTVSEFRYEASQLKQGLVGGVKPVPVVIPETGKLLTLSGALPPARIHVEIEAKPN